MDGKTTTAKPCADMDEIRERIDRMDDLLVPLLVERTAYVAQAAAFKPTIEDVVVPERIEAIVARVRAMAVDLGGDPDMMESTYRSLIDASIGVERKHWLRRNGED